MITRLEARDYRCLKQVDQPLGPFHVLAGPNGSGKSAFLDVLGFVKDLVTGNLQQALEARSRNFRDLVWCREGYRFDLGVEASIPPGLMSARSIRYLLGVHFDVRSDQPGISSEEVWVDTQAVIRREGNRTQGFLETEEAAGPVAGLELPGVCSALANLSDEGRFPGTAWLRKLLGQGVQPIRLRAEALRAPNPPDPGMVLTPAGSNLARVVAALQQEWPQRFQDWVAHLQTSLPDVEAVRTDERPDGRYVVVRYRGGPEVPSWMISEGTLRLMALTILPYLPVCRGIYLVEEPEASLHPHAIETVYQSLSSLYEGQVFIETQSPLLVALANKEQLLCFRRTEEEGTVITSGAEHPALAQWKRELTLGELFAAGVLD